MRDIPAHLLFPMGASLTYVIPLTAALRLGRGALSEPLRIIALYCGVTLVQSCIMIWLALRGTTNPWLIHVFTPVELVLLLLAFAVWQVRESARTMLLAMIPLFLITWGFLLVSFDSPADFPIYGRTLAALLIVAVSAYTLVTQAQYASTDVTSHPWFWVTVGLLAYFPYVVLLNPLSSAFKGRDEVLFVVYRVNAALMIVSNLLITWAILCQKRRSSGGSSSPRLSPA